MNRKIIVFLALALSGNLARGAETSFDGIKCDSQIESVLIGRSMKNGKVAEIEKKYKALNLKLLWSDIGACALQFSVEFQPCAT